jgi:hypothetical protein
VGARSTQRSLAQRFAGHFHFSGFQESLARRQEKGRRGTARRVTLHNATYGVPRPRPPMPPRPRAAFSVDGGTMFLARRYTPLVPYISLECAIMLASTPARATSFCPCFTISSAF